MTFSRIQLSTSSRRNAVTLQVIQVIDGVPVITDQVSTKCPTILYYFLMAHAAFIKSNT